MWLAVEIPTWGWLQKQFIKDALEATRFSEYEWLSEEINRSISEGLQCDSFAHWYHDLMQVCPCHFIDRCLLLLFSLQWPSLTIWSFISLTLWRFWTMVSFLSAQSWYKIFVNKLSLEFSFPSIDSIKTNFGFFCPPESVITPEIFVCDNVSTKLTIILPFPCWRNIHRLDCLCCSGINAVKDSQMKPETPNASDASPHSWSKMQIETF